MSRQTNLAASPAPHSPNPLEALHDLLAADMASTNEMILARLQSPVETIPMVAQHLIASGGKRIRPLLTLACAAMFDSRGEKVSKLAAAVEFIHSATLLHDDVVDGSEVRRGKTAANLVFGNQTAVLVGDFLFSRAFELMVETESLRVLHLLSRAAAIIAEGEVLQLKTAHNLSTQIDEYIHVISAKTAALFAAAAASGPALGGAPVAIQDALYAYGHHLGIAFQIADDVLDYTGDTANFGKQQGNDFAEGKMTAPVIFAQQFAGETERHFWEKCLVTRDTTPDDFERAREYLVQHDAFHKSHALAEEHKAKAIEALSALPDHPVKPILADLAAFAVLRQK